MSRLEICVENERLPIHDIVEIDAGDTYAYDAEGLQSQKEREEAAKERIFSLLPEDQKKEFTEIFDEFEANNTPEARYAHAMDNLQPLMLNHSNNGGDWKEHDVTAEKVYGRQKMTALGSRRLYELSDRIIQENIQKGNLKRPEADMTSAEDTLRAYEGTERLLYSAPDNPYEGIYIRAKIIDGLLTVTDSECDYGPDGGWSHRIFAFDAENTVKVIEMLMENNPDPLEALKSMLTYQERTGDFRKMCDRRGIRYRNTLAL